MLIESQKKIGPISMNGPDYSTCVAVVTIVVFQARKGSSVGQIFTQGRGFIGYPKGRNRDIKLVN